MGRSSWGCLLLALSTVAGCSGGHKFEPPSRTLQVAQADSIYASVHFDTIAWNSQTERMQAGNEVFAERCRRCHGYLGEDHTQYAQEKNLQVPSLVKPDWSMAGDLDAVRRKIYIGHPAGMPTWGIAGLSPREIDAVAYYILDGLRPEILHQDTAR